MLPPAGPIPLRSFPTLRQRPSSGFGSCASASSSSSSALDDEKANVAMAAIPPSSSSSSSSSSPLLMETTKRSHQEARRIVRDAMAFSANPPLSPSFTSPSLPLKPARIAVAPKGSGLCIPSQPLAADKPRDEDVLCWEIAGEGKQWKYLQQHPDKGTHQVFHIVDLKEQLNPLADLATFVRSCLLPEGYPESVAPSYVPYMRWRALKYLFGGAMGVFTTRSLLHAVGVSHRGAASSAIAINWVIKDGAGRIGKMLFARQGKKFDCDMKQMRFTGDLLMELGAGMELATITAPHFFLPLACAANIAKNVAAVTSTSTRAPIYKAFAKGENIGDVTAKGECISNIADLLGTGIGIFLSRGNPSLVPTFAMLSCGYLFSSYREIGSVILPTLNKARFGVAVKSFLDTGKVPSVFNGNRKERIFLPPWKKDKSVVLGARVNEAFPNPQKFLDTISIFQKENYLVACNVLKDQTFVILKEKASADDVLKAAFHGHLLSDILESSMRSEKADLGDGYNLSPVKGLLDSISCAFEQGVEAATVESCKHINNLYDAFRHQASSQGWIIADTMLNPGNTRLCLS